ncbi:unnamed protein product [Blepharisma stoltei]|uniref:Uncharacterized protein n=1 Tax=Blepharisma stoltei TaxID=1481888 RepID=A0AAU9IKA1_9CILI|nr:unnamed protein product [Blepharisma stoltei]
MSTPISTQKIPKTLARDSSDSKPKKSFQWLLEKDPSEIIEVNLPDIQISSPEILVENTRSQHNIDLNHELDQIYSRTTRSAKKKQISEEITRCPSVSEFPPWYSLCKEIHIISSMNLEWLQYPSTEEESLGIFNASQGLTNDKHDIYQAMLYWTCSNLDENDWLISLKSVFYTFAFNKIDWFYVIFRKILVLFKKDNQKPTVLIFNPTLQLISNLKKYSIENEENVEIDNLQGYRKNKKLSPVTLKGKSVFRFYNYLINNHSDAKIISPHFFLNGTLKYLNLLYCGEVKSLGIPELSEGSQFKIQKKYKLSIEGPISPQAVKILCMVLQNRNTPFTINLVPDLFSSQAFCPHTISWLNGSYSISSTSLC